MTSARDGLAHSVQVRLARHAREIGADPNLVLTRFALERFLYRLSRSPYADRFVLKGALLMLAWLGDSLRPTRDADLLGVGDLSDDAVLRIFREVCAIEVEPDAVSFDAESVTVNAIREEDAYGGRRVAVRGTIGKARIFVQVDIGIGDAVHPPPQWLEYPSLLEFPKPHLRAYSREAVVAEKTHAMVLLGMYNSRMKDYFDVYALMREERLNMRELGRAIASTFTRRRTDVPATVPIGLSDAYSAAPGAQSQWRAFLLKGRIEAPELADVVRAIRDGILPALEIARKGADAP